MVRMRDAGPNTCWRRVLLAWRRPALPERSQASLGVHALVRRGRAGVHLRVDLEDVHVVATLFDVLALALEGKHALRPTN